MNKFLPGLICLFLSLNVLALDYRERSQSIELMRMQEFHLQQARDKLANKKLAQAWGDLAYLLCKIPNHIVALQDMMEIAPQLQKQQELGLFFDKALTQFPNDQELKELYAKFLLSLNTD